MDEEDTAEWERMLGEQRTATSAVASEVSDAGKQKRKAALVALTGFATKIRIKQHKKRRA